MLHQGPDKWYWLRERLKDAARLPLMVLVIFACSMAAWVCGWALFRAAVFVFNRYLDEPW